MNENLLKLAKAACLPNASANFTAEDANSAFRNALLEETGLDVNASLKEIRNNRAVFSIVESIVDELLPIQLQEATGVFAEIKNFARDEEPIFLMKNINRNRVALGITKAARGGIYKARRLDNGSFTVTTSVYGVSYMATLEDLILGKSTIADLVEIITKGFLDQIYVEVIKTMRGLDSALPAANKATANDSPLALTAALDKVINTISKYGPVKIIGFNSELAKLHNGFVYEKAYGAISTADADDVRNTGRVQKYKGRELFELPNYFIDATNTQSYFKENDIWVLSTNKPVKVALRGEAYTNEVPQAAGGIEYHMHKMIGVGVTFVNNVGKVTDSKGDSTGLY